MDYRYLRAFLLTAQYSSFSKAAKALNIAQSAISRQIKLLEESLEEELIIRSSKKVLLTNKGKELYLATSHFDQVALDIFKKEDARPINIGILHGLLKNWFVPRLVKFYKKNQRHINIHVGIQSELRKKMEEGTLDIVFTTDNIQSELISSLKLFVEKFVLISKGPVNRKKLHEYRWIVYCDTDVMYRLSKKKSESIITVESVSTMVELVRNDVGVAVVPDHVLKKNEALNIQDLPLLDKSEIYMTTLNYKNMPSHIREFSEIVQK